MAQDGGAEADGPRRPFVQYNDDEKDPENYVLVSVDIPGLKKQWLGKDASNAAITFSVEERSFCLSVALEKKKGKEIFQYEVKKLPDLISTSPKKTYYKVLKDEVQLHLHKAKPARWSRYLSETGLETAPSPAEQAMEQG